MAHQAELPLRRSLAALQDPPLPEALWPRVARARARQLARRRMALGGAAAAVFAALLAPVALLDRGAVPGTSGQLAAGAEPPRAPAASDATARLRSLDRELQAAYRRGSDSAEIAQLWEARAALLRTRDPATPVRPVRI